MSQVSQCVACNGLHVIVERCCRWLLMTHDRVDGDELTLTHEFLSYMLGVRRSSVTEVLQSLQQQGLIRYGQGKITVLNREGLEELSCECYQCVRDEYDRLLG
jgi:CRP-like cAMP-binding protein